MKGRMRVVGWSVERACVWHEESCARHGDTNWDDVFVCPVCGDVPDGGDACNYDLEIHGVYYPGAPAYTPRGEYAPVDPPEPPEFHIGRICFAGTDVEFPWSLSEAEQEAIEEAVLTDDEGEVERWDYE